MSEWIGNKIKLRIFGASHADCIGVELSGIKADNKVDFEMINDYLDRRKACDASYSTARREPDIPVFESGLKGNIVTGETIRAVIKNSDINKKDYSYMKGLMRPGHADYAAFVKFGGEYDMSGGGKFSGRMTAPVCVAGGIAASILKSRGIFITAYLSSVGNIEFGSYRKDGFILPAKSEAFALAFGRKRVEVNDLFEKLREEGDSVGGKIECVVCGLPVGIGDSMFQSMESKISSLAFGIPAIKAIEFGAGVDFSMKKGSEVRDELFYDGDKVVTETNFNGGINGGMTNGMPLTFGVTVKPTPSIAKPCKTVDVFNKRNAELTIKGRHDVCIAPRAVPVVESIAALAIYDCLGDL